MINNNLQYKYQNNSIGVLPLLLIPALKLTGALLPLILPFVNFKGHSDYYYYDMALQGRKDYDKVIKTAVNWASNSNGLLLLSARITLKESPSYIGLTRWQSLVKLFTDKLIIDDKNIPIILKTELLKSLIALINYAVSIGALPANNYINSLGIMAPEPIGKQISNKINNIAKSNYLLPIVAISAVLLYLKK